ncbi:hypothetical protein CRG98_033012 [Punica granatum]|uniref:Clp R domain-containing protein n=1 Tax=Punica granatum TaxID=22663 RepID=A0A2I0ISP7_PUNGR|nr:hypothetical protein CRG98_033012 [Punica granatum]
MPTPVSIARQCLTAEAAHALDEAVAVARRRGHAQTTSLHAVSALLSLPSSVLREACARARGSGPPYPSRLQFKALELCLSVSLDRVPSGQLTDDPPVSNALMAAIKRSQANQRRQPENFHLYHQLSSQSSINNTIKVELQQLIISILDDPGVSRVFGEAGFRSSEIKLAILRPLPHLLRYTGRPRGPPLLMESFVPFAGFFSSCGEYNGQVLSSSPYQCPSQCNLCTEKKSERETIQISKSGLAASVADQYQYSLPSWLRMTELGSSVKAKDDRVAMSTTVTGLQNEWGDKFQHAHRGPQFPVSNNHRMDSQVKTIMGFLPSEERSERINDQSINGARCKSINSSLSADTPKISRPQLSVSLPQVAPATDSSRKESFLTKLWEKSSKPEDMDSGLMRCGSNSSVDDGCRASPSSVTSRNTNMGQRIHSEPEIQRLEKLPTQTHSSVPDISEQFFSDDFKAIFKDIREKVGRQQEAISRISQMVASFRARNFGTRHQMSTRGDFWLTFLGPDRMGKWKVAVSLCEILYGNREHLIHIDLSSLPDDLNHRGKTPVDIIAGELSKKPVCVVFLENVDRADEQVQSSLLQAILTGKFSDSRGREIGVHRAIFVATLSFLKSNQILHSHELDGTASRFSEERVLEAKGWPMKILVKHANDNVINASSPIHVNKRKLMGLDEDEASSETLEMVNKRIYRISSKDLDLNLPAENDEPQDSDECSMECDVCDNSKAWLLDFIDRTDATVVFKPYDFDSLAERILKEIRECFRQTVGLECLIEIEPKVMEQLLSAIYTSDGDDKQLKDWMANVLSREFAQLQRRYELTDRTTVSLLACCEDVSMEEQVSGSCLPCKIFVNLCSDRDVHVHRSLE